MNRFLSALKTVGKKSVQVAEIALPIAIETAAPELGTLLTPATKITAIALAGSATKITGENTLNPLESFAINMVLGVLQSVIKNPAHSAALENQLVGVANDIYMTYGLTPPVAAVTGSVVATK